MLFKVKLNCESRMTPGEQLISAVPIDGYCYLRNYEDNFSVLLLYRARIISWRFCVNGKYILERYASCSKGRLLIRILDPGGPASTS